MRFIKVAAEDNGAHKNQNGGKKPGNGWAVIPEDMEIPSTFPFVNVTASKGVVTELTAGTVPEPTPNPAAEIAQLKAELAASDYKIIKCSEAQLIGEALPYDVQELHTERQAIRDRINELEGSE